ncbi:Growth-regulating factor 11 [Linum grandiflorum]
MEEVDSPWRCRRTDGKKWRCKRNVFSDHHKYCDRHMFRGRCRPTRSRKLVEQQLYPDDNKVPAGNNKVAAGVTVSVADDSKVAGDTTALPSVAVTAADSRVQGLDFSPNSVLPEEDQRRCRRTDGKKWRCRREVVSNEKYCDRHLHRGVRRRPEASSGDVPPPLPPATSNQLECCSKMLPGKDDNATTSSASSDATVSEVLLFN